MHCCTNFADLSIQPEKSDYKNAIFLGELYDLPQLVDVAEPQAGPGSRQHIAVVVEGVVQFRQQTNALRLIELGSRSVCR